MKRLYVIITLLLILGSSDFVQSKTPPPVNRDSVSGYISMTIDSGTCYSRYISARLYDNLLTFHHWERSNDGITFSNVSTSSTLTLSNISDKFWIRAVVKTGNDSCYTDTAFYNEVCAYDTIRIDTMYNAALSGHPTYINTNFRNHEDIYSKCWTISGSQDPGRTLLRIDYSAIPKKSIIKKSTIFLFSDLKSDRIHSSQSRTNESYFHRIDTAWNLNAVTWNTQPKVSKADSVILPQIAPTTTSASFDITNFTKYWCANPSINYGMRMIIKTELAYCRQSYFSRNTVGADSVKRPYVKVVYYKPQIIVDTRNFDLDGNTGIAGILKFSNSSVNVQIDSAHKIYLPDETYPLSATLKIYKSGIVSDTTFITMNIDTTFKVYNLKTKIGTSSYDLSPSMYTTIDNKLILFNDNRKTGIDLAPINVVYNSGVGIFNPQLSSMYVAGDDSNAKFSLTIFDLSDQVLYTTLDPKAGWDGKSNKYTTTREYVPAGIYKYAIQFNSQIFSGQFEVRY